MPGQSRHLKTIAQHAVVKGSVAHPVAPAAARHQIGSQIHVFHAAGKGHVCSAQEDFLSGRNDRLCPGPTDSVNRHRRHRYRKTGVDRCLAGRIHLHAGLDNVTHNHDADIIGLEPGASDCGLDRRSTQIRCRDLLEASAEGTDRSGPDLQKRRSELTS